LRRERPGRAQKKREGRSAQRSSGARETGGNWGNPVRVRQFHDGLDVVDSLQINDAS